MSWSNVNELGVVRGECGTVVRNEKTMCKLEKRARDFIENVLVVNLDSGSSLKMGSCHVHGNWGGSKIISANMNPTAIEHNDVRVVRMASQLAKDYGICSRYGVNGENGFEYEFWIGAK